LDLAPDSVVERARPVGQVRSRKRPADELLKEDWFDRAIQLEAIDPGGAEAAYRAAIAANPADSRPYQNLGLLLSKMKRTAEAHALSEKAAKTFPDKAELQFNLGVSCETLGRDEDAVRAYTAALECDPGFADAHYNLALVHERLGHKKEVIRHLNAYRRLVR
jgi:tetratricopeptide (TPR) repeat protein